MNEEQDEKLSTTIGRWIKDLSTKSGGWCKKFTVGAALGIAWCILLVVLLICSPIICIVLIYCVISRKLKDRKRARKRARYLEWVEGTTVVIKGTRREDGGPEWRLDDGKRPITPPPLDNSLNVSKPEPESDYKIILQTSFFFTKIPLELRRRIYDFALGDEMLRLQVEGPKLKAWRCSKMTRNFWSGDDWTKELYYSWKYLNHPAPDEAEEDWKWQRHQGNVNLLRTCRQV